MAEALTCARCSMSESARIVSAIESLTLAVKELADLCKHEPEQNRSRFRLVTMNDLIEMETRMSIKLSDLKGEVSAIRAQVGKIWGEQQKKYDGLLAKFIKLEQTLSSAELDAETTTEVEAFKAELKAFDDTIPDTAV